ncbi:class I lanthipeptide [Spirosoma sp.]|uniref:class I lanthipeptide n=1 Tax=Spirosoma sp. TaxID=1899569 RepID=UPI002607F354|nr:class I lanthipeptide [Spirosoma sp.]MCX6212986.1 class I lanthipeptide [Spirosoma sp.]
MKTNKHTQAIKLAKETVAKLSEEDLKQIVGGATKEDDSSEALDPPSMYCASRINACTYPK